jgi:hypothetical protein
MKNLFSTQPYVKGYLIIKSSKKLNQWEKNVLHTILSWNVTGKKCYNTNQQIADIDCMSRSVVVRAIKSLKEKNIIKALTTINSHSMWVDNEALLSYLETNEIINDLPNFIIDEPLQPEEPIETILEEQSTTLQPEEQSDNELSKEELIKLLKQIEPKKEYVECILEFIDEITTQTELKEYVYNINNPRTKTYTYEQQNN